MRPGWSQLRMILLMLLAGAPANAQAGVSGKVLDDTGVAVAGVHIELHSKTTERTVSADSDVSGNFTLQLPRSAAGETDEFAIRASRKGFFVYSGAVRLGPETTHLTITLNHLQEFAESIDVTYSPPTIDLQEPADKKQLDNVEILTVPYPAPQDLRNALPLMNGVVLDPGGRVHVNGGSSEQTNYLLDGFHVSDPATGRLEARLNIETVQTLDLDGSRFTAERGKGSAGSLDIQTKMGDDRWRFGGTNFFPGVSTTGGLHVDRFAPRLEVSGPLAKGRAWFHDGLDFVYSLDTVSGLPRGQNRSSGVTVNDLSRFQVNLTPGEYSDRQPARQLRQYESQRPLVSRSPRNHHQAPPEPLHVHAEGPDVLCRRHAARSRIRGHAHGPAADPPRQLALRDHPLWPARKLFRESRPARAAR